MLARCAAELEMAILCRDLGLLFILTPATGSTAVGRLLVDRFAGTWLPAEADGPLRQKHTTLDELLETGLLSAEDRSRFLVVTTVRNPYDRLVSMYHKRRSVTAEQLADPNFWMNRRAASKALADVDWIQGHSFADWVRRRFFRSWLPRTVRGRPPSAYDRFVSNVDVVMRHERLQDDFDEVLERLGSPSAPIPRVNVSRARTGRRYRAEYDVPTRALVSLGQRRDLSRFGYRF